VRQPSLDPLSAFPAPVPLAPAKASAAEGQGFQVIENPVRGENKSVPPISGPSMLGLDRPVVSRPDPFQPSPSLDPLREKSFSGLDSFLEPEQPKSGAGRIFLLVILLAGLAVAGWWTYSNYLGAAAGRKPTSTNASSGTPPAEMPPTAKPPSEDAHPGPGSGSTHGTPPSSTPVPEGPSENASVGSDDTHKPPGAETKIDVEANVATPKTETLKPAARAPAKPASTPAKSVLVRHAETKRETVVASAKAPTLRANAGADTGDAAFRKGEAYLYGRGLPENCDEAIKNLKAASAKSNAKARSAFGTMYATGHCVPRDFPTSYLWFAMALRADPNNQILEKDLSAVWNQMTPPERQMATRMKE
jgi:hypothetical protein